ncbi:MAG: hypothetical protein HY766_05720 [candidate division NC10 bacterium]|nr:hypothetical protein [candidate division NC10 bacterium]
MGTAVTVRAAVLRLGSAAVPERQHRSTAAPQHPIEIVIEDTGIGIPQKDLPRITERFYRVDKARSRELGGTGLGLAIVKHLVQVQHGTLAIQSEIGRGTTVRFTLPVAPAPLIPTM